MNWIIQSKQSGRYFVDKPLPLGFETRLLRSEATRFGTDREAERWLKSRGISEDVHLEPVAPQVRV